MKLTKEKQLTKLMQEYNASDLDELMDILPDLDFEDDYEDELPQQEEVDESYADLRVNSGLIGDVSCPFAGFPFN